MLRKTIAGAGIAALASVGALAALSPATAGDEPAKNLPSLIQVVQAQDAGAAKKPAQPAEKPARAAEKPAMDKSVAKAKESTWKPHDPNAIHRLPPGFSPPQHSSR
jgi:hypothetical protein